MGNGSSSAPLGPVHVDVIGPPRVLVDGVPVRFRYRKAEALTYHLAVEGGRHPRARLAALLWDDVAGGANLRVVLNDVRKHLGPHVIVDAATQRVGLTDVHCDVDALDGPAADAPNGRLGPQLRADASLLEGFDVADAPAFEAWRAEADAHVRERLARLRARALDAALDADDLPTALDLADATCRAAPWDVPALARLVRLALRLGASERAAHRLDGTEAAVAEVGGDEALAQVAALRRTLRASSAAAHPPETFHGHLRAEERFAAALAEGRRRITVTGTHGAGTSGFVQRALRASADVDAGAVLALSLRDVPTERLATHVRDGVAGRVGLTGRAGASGVALLDDVPDGAAARAAVRDGLAAAALPPDARVVAAGTAPLGADGEVEIPLGPLPLPALGDERDAGVLDAPALALLRTPARDRVAPYAPADEDLAAWVRVARETGGHPGALARVGAHLADVGAPAPLRDGGPTRFALAAFGSDVDAAEVLPAVGALAPDARASTRALAHLRAGGDVAAVAAVAGTPAASVRAHLEAAVRLGVATVDGDGAGRARRFRMRPDVAWALRAEAAAAPDAAAQAARHAAWVQGAVDALVADDGDRPVGAASAAMLDRLDDVEAALDHDADADPARALHVASRAWPAYRRIGRATHLLRYVAPLLDAHAATLPLEGVATAWATRGNLETLAGQLPSAKASFHAAHAAHATRNDGAGQARVHLNLAQVEARLQDLDAAERHLDRGQALAEAHERPWVAAACIGNRGHVLRRRGDRAGAAAAYHDAIARLEPLNDPYSVAGLRIAELGLLATDGLPADVVRGVHHLDLVLHAIDGTQRQSLRRPFGAMRDAVAASGHDVAAERLDGVARDHRLA